MNDSDHLAPISKWGFIGGASRSGTSLLQAILNEHSSCTSPPESHILETFAYAPVSFINESFKDRKRLLDLLINDKWIHRLNIDPEKVIARLTEQSTKIDLFRIYMEEYALRINKTVVVDGCPINIWFLKKLKEDFPDCYIIHIVRDPRDVVISTQKAGYNKKFFFPPPQIAKQFLRGYLQSIRFAKAYGEKYHKIYYEELITDPEKVVRGICKFLDINFEPAMLEFQHSRNQVAAEEETWKENLSKPILKDNFGKWKTEANKKDVIQIEYICRRFFDLEKEHYQTSEFMKGGNSLKNWPMLMPYLLSEIKGKTRSLLNNETTKERLDKMSPFERLMVNGMMED